MIASSAVLVRCMSHPVGESDDLMERIILRRKI